jgi:Flp pilus assembly protein TadD
VAHRTVAAILVLITMGVEHVPARAGSNDGPELSPAFAAFSLNPELALNDEKRQARHSVTVTAVPVPETPFTEDQVRSMVHDGLGDWSGAKAIERRGLDFWPTENFLESLRAAGASPSFLASVLAAKHSERANAPKPANQLQVFALLAAQVPSHRVALLVRERGVDFEPNNEYLREVLLAGGDEELRNALKDARIANPEPVNPAAQRRVANAAHHAAQGAEFARNAEYAQAEQEYRAALLDSQDGDLYLGLAFVQGKLQEWNAAESAARDALRLNPHNGMAHAYCGAALAQKGDWSAAIAEEREALRLNADNAFAHNELGVALEKQGDRRGALVEYRAASTLDPGDAAYRQNYTRMFQHLK